MTQDWAGGSSGTPILAVPSAIKEMPKSSSRSDNGKHQTALKYQRAESFPG